MTETRQIQRTPTEREEAPTGAVRLPYMPPQLTPLGALRTVTLGGSPGTGESANPGLRKNL